MINFLNYHKILIINIVVVLLVLISCLGENDKEKEKSKIDVLNQKQDTISRLDEIIERGRLIATTDYNSTNYFIYRGQPMGYQFELLKLFAEHLGVRLELIINNDINESFEYLNSDKCDLIAIGLTITKERNKFIDFTEPFNQTRQVLIQRKPDNWRKMRTMDEINKQLIRNPLELAGKTIHIQKNTSFLQRLENLSDEIGDSIIIIEDPEKEVEELIKAVAKKEIDFTVCDEHIALVNQKYYPVIDVKTPVSFSQNIAWAVKKGEKELLTEINNWILGFKNSLTCRLIYNRYFKNPRSVNIARSEFHSIGGGKISRYDEIIKSICENNKWDWRLIASLIYQESGFRPNAKSWVGAYGLMQLMPFTAEKYGIDSLSTPEEQIEAGLKFIQLIDKQLPKEISDKEERKKFILASYNAGIAHVYDARRLAEKNNKDPNIWTGNVDKFILLKSNPKYYSDPVVKYGYCRGEEPYNFVNEILERYEHYRNVIKN